MKWEFKYCIGVIRLGNEGNLVVGGVWKRKFTIALLAGFLGLVGLIGIFGITDRALDMALGGIGDFYVEFDELEGTGFQLIPEIGKTGNSDAEPIIRNITDEVEITNLHIYKDLKMPAGGWVRIHVKADGPTKISGLIQDARFIDADLSFNNLAIEESNTEDFRENWTQNADTVNIKDAVLVTDYLFQEVVSLNGAKISVEKIDEPKMYGEK